MFDDLKLIDIAETSKCFLVHPVTKEQIKDKDGNPAWIEVYPKESKQGRKAERKIIDARLKSKHGDVTTASIDAQAVEMLSALTNDWYLVKGDGDPADYECNEEMKKKLYSDDSLRWVRDQVDSHVMDLANFFTG